MENLNEFDEGERERDRERERENIADGSERLNFCSSSSCSLFGRIRKEKKVTES
jgi:hypothetical protein